MTIQTFVTIHDQALIEACEADGRFAGLDYTYLFVGPRWITGTVDTNGAPLVICRDYADNIEHWPSFYDFTGWWVLAHHDLITADRVMFLQYDMRPAVPDLAEQVNVALDGRTPPPLPPEMMGATIIHPKPAMAAFVCGHRSAHNWMLLLAGFEQAFYAGLDTRFAPMPPADFEEWPTTQGTAWNTADFHRFMLWVRPMLDVWASNQWAGHLAERSVYAWLRHVGAEWANLPGVIHHDHGDCHGTCSRMAGDLATADARAATFGRV